MLIAHTYAVQSEGRPYDITTPDINTTGARTIVVFVSMTSERIVAAWENGTFFDSFGNEYLTLLPETRDPALFTLKGYWAVCLNPVQVDRKSTRLNSSH